LATLLFAAIPHLPHYRAATLARLTTAAARIMMDMNGLVKVHNTSVDTFFSNDKFNNIGFSNIILTYINSKNNRKTT
jgi:hypothetical protein